jgi:hypothetical protein
MSGQELTGEILRQSQPGGAAGTGTVTPSGTATAETAFGNAVAAGTSDEYSRGDHTHGTPTNPVAGTAHATLTTGIHGAGTSDLATTSQITTHAALTTGIHGLGTISGAASADYMLKALYTAKGDLLVASNASTPSVLTVAGTNGYVLAVDNTTATGLKYTALLGGGDMAKATYDPDSDGVIALAQLDASIATTGNVATHAGLTGSHGAGTILSLAAATALITTHAGSTATHGTGTSSIASTNDITVHAGLTATHGAGTIASVAAATALITTHAGSTDAHIGGAGTVLSMAAGTVLITTHAGSTAAHIGGAGTVLSMAAATVLITTHAGSTDAHIGGAGTVASVAAVTAQITTHNTAATAHGITWVMAAAQTVTDSALTNITNWTYAAATGSTYKVTCYISSSASHTAGIKFAAAYSGSNHTFQGEIYGTGVAGSTVSQAITATAVAMTGYNKVAATAAIMITGILKTAGTAGNFTIQMAAVSTAATSYIRANSMFEIVPIVRG